MSSSPSRKSGRGSKPVTISSPARKTTPTKRSKSPSKTPHTTDEHGDDELPNRKVPRTPPRRSPSSTAARSESAKIVTPAASTLALERKKTARKESSPAKSNARRSLNLGGSRKGKSSSTAEKSDEKEVATTGGGAKKKLPFGLAKKPIEIPANVQRVYNIVHKHSGSLGGNGHGGAIYGELTTGSMQKMTNLMMEHTGLSKTSRFIDVGCGLGKPNLHVASYPGVDFSYGIEMEHVRWMLGMTNLEHVLKAAKEEEFDEEEEESKIGHSCYFAHGDITEANFFDPFTHVYMFDIGFPPRLFHQLAEMFNNSQSEYLICYHGPKLMKERYGFNVELIIQTPTSMHGSAEGHMGYIYRRDQDAKQNNAKVCKTKTHGVACDPLFADAWKMCREGLVPLLKYTSDEVEKQWGVNNKRLTRASRKKSTGLFEEEKKE